MIKNYYFFYLEMALRKKDDLHIYAFINVSHVPTKKLIEIFKIDLKKDPDIIQGYFLTKTSFKKHKKYITETIGAINLDVFEYCLQQYAASDFKQIRSMYKESLME
jgi:hypothetical protein